MTEHTIKEIDMRPIKSKHTKGCTNCRCTGRDLNKYRTCEKYRDHLKAQSEEVALFISKQPVMI